MLERIRMALVTSYAGAIIVGWTLAQGVSSVIGLVLSPVMNVLIVYQNTHHSVFSSSSFQEVKIFDWMQLGAGAIKTAVVLGIGLLLLNWLYIPKPEPTVSEEVEA